MGTAFLGGAAIKDADLSTLGDVKALLNALGLNASASVARRRASQVLGMLSKRETGVTIVCRGSSSTFGTGASTDAARYVNRLARMIRAAFPLLSGDHPTAVLSMSSAGALSGGAIASAGINVVGAGISGSRASAYGGAATPYVNANTRAAQAALAGVCAYLDMIGANDYANAHTAAEYRAAIQAEVDATKAAMGSKRFVHVFTHTYPRIDTAAVTNHVSEWAAFLAALYEVQAANAHVLVIDNATPFAEMGVTGAESVDPNDLLGSDDIHPNDRGHAFIAESLFRFLFGISAVVTVAASGGGGVTAPTVTTAAFNGITEDVAFSQTFTQDGTAGTWSATGLPPGMTIASATGVVSGTSPDPASGNADITVQNSAGSNTKTFAWAVSAAGASWMTVDESDSFNRADDASGAGTSTMDAALGGTPVAWQQNANAFRILSNALSANGSVSGGQFIPKTIADYEMRSLIKTLSNNTAANVFTMDGRRSQLASSGATQYRLIVRANGSAQIYTGSTALSISAPAGTFAAGDWVGLRMVGSTLSIVKHSAPTGAGTVVATGTDSTISSGAFAGFSRAAAYTGEWDAVVFLRQ